MDERLVEQAAEAIRSGRPVVLPTDTVYGLCAKADSAEPVHEMYRLKGRSDEQPTALVAASVEQLVERVPELRGRGEALVRAFLPGPFTLVLANPAARLPWLTGSRPETIGVRLPELGDTTKAILDRTGAVAATSANLRGGPDPRTLDEVPLEIREACAALVDGGELPGTPSTVVDLSGDEPEVLREGAVPASEALALAEPLFAARG